MERRAHPCACPMCDQAYTVARNPPVCLVCNHHVCLACASNVLKSRYGRPCPVCGYKNSILGNNLQIDIEYLRNSQSVLQSMPLMNWPGIERGRDPPHQKEPSTVPCRYIRNNEECPFGDRCTFDHSEKSKHRVPCTFYNSGYCKRGQQCTFYHDFHLQKNKNLRRP